MTTESQVTDRQIAAFRRFLMLLPHGKDLGLVVLKAHLLVEEQINLIIQERLMSPEALLGEERFESRYRILLAQAFFDSDHMPWLWKGVLQLNKLRNRVAHMIEPKGLENLMQNFVETIPTGKARSSDALQDQFEFAMWCLFEAISSLVERQGATVLELVPPTTKDD